MRPLHTSLSLALISVILTGCISKPLHPFTTDAVPQMRVPAIQRPEQDKRGRFEEIFCTVLEARKETIPDYLPCKEAITTLEQTPEGSGSPVNLGVSQYSLRAIFIPGLGRDCVSEWLAEENTVADHLRQFGYQWFSPTINGLGSGGQNAKLIRDMVMSISSMDENRDLILIGYSKGATDALMALTQYPEIQPRITAMVSVSGAIGGSPLANDISNGALNLLELFPGATCQADKEGALADLQPSTRQAWLSHNPLPANIAYYSLISYPTPDKISSALKVSYNKLSKVDARNDGQIIFYDQFIPNSYLVGYLNADHWAISTAIARTHKLIGSTFANHNAFPREAMYEAILRLVEEDLNSLK